MPYTSISRSKVVTIKKWMHDLARSVHMSKSETRLLISRSFAYFECACIYELELKLSLSEDNIELLALLAINKSLEHFPTLTGKYGFVFNSLMKNSSFSHDQQVSIFRALMRLNSKSIITKCIYTTLCELLFNAEDTSEEEKENAFYLLDLFLLTYFTIFMNNKKVACACLSVSRLLSRRVYDSVWSEALERSSNLAFSDFINEFDLVFVIVTLKPKAQ